MKKNRLTSAKAWIGAVLASLAAIGTALKTEHGQLSWSDVPLIFGAFAAGWQGVYWKSNERKGARNAPTQGSTAGSNEHPAGH